MRRGCAGHVDHGGRAAAAARGGGAVREEGAHVRICFIAPRFPYPTTKGDTLRVFHQLKALSRRHQITLASLSDGPVPADQLAPVASFCEEVIVAPHSRPRAAANLMRGPFSSRPLQVEYFRSGVLSRKLASLLSTRRFDAFHATLIRMVPYVWDL